MGQRTEITRVSMNTGLGRVLPANLVYKQEVSILPPLSSISPSTAEIKSRRGSAEQRPSTRPRKDEPIKRFRCEHPGCGKAFSKSDHLKTHIRIHTGERPYKCEHNECKRKFSDLANLRRHNRIHTGDKPFKCDECGKSFAVSSNLKQHKRTHSGLRPYDCHVCGKTFSHVSSRRKHMLQHSSGCHGQQDKAGTNHTDSRTCHISTLPSTTKPGLVYNNTVIFEYPGRTFLQPPDQPSLAPNPVPARTFPANPPVMSTSSVLGPTLVSTFTTSSSYPAYSGHHYSGMSPCMYSTYIPGRLDSTISTSPCYSAVQATSPPSPYHSPNQQFEYKNSHNNVYQIDGNFDHVSPPNSIESTASLEENFFQVDGNFDSISPPNSIDSAVPLEELYSFFKSRVPIKVEEGYLNQTIEVKTEPFSEPKKMKQEVLEQSREIEKIKQDLLKSLFHSG
ncbi:hypothetical protein ACHWQZ_G017951 [Mnemiopsis leidyi]